MPARSPRALQHRAASFFLFVLVCLTASALTLAPAAAQPQPPGIGATAELRDATGRLVANATFREGRGEVLISIMFASSPPLTGTHAVHIDETGRCDPPDFRTSGNIFNPFGKQHGRD